MTSTDTMFWQCAFLDVSFKPQKLSCIYFFTIPESCRKVGLDALLVICFSVANYHKEQQTFVNSVSMGQESGHGLARDLNCKISHRRQSRFCWATMSYEN